MNINKKFLFTAFASAICFFVGVYSAVLIVLPQILDVNKYKAVIFDELHKTTGFTYSAENIDLKMAFSPYLNLYLHHVKVDYPNGSNFLKVKDANAKIEVIPLVVRKIKINKIILTRPIASISMYSDASTSIERYFKPIEKKSGTKFAFSLHESIPDIKMSRYKVKINDVNFFHPFLLQGESLFLSDLRLNESLKLKTKGTLKQSDTNILNYDLDIDTFLTKNPSGHFFTVSPFFNLKKYAVQSDVYAHLKIREDKEIPFIDGDMALTNLAVKIDERKLSGNKIKLKFSGKEVLLDALLRTSQVDEALAKGSISFGSHKDIDLTVKAMRADLANLEDLSIAILDSFNIKNELRNYKISGLANLDFRIKSNFKRMESSGNAEILNCSVLSKHTPFKITQANAGISFENNEINVKQAKALLNNTPINISGNIDSHAVVNMLVKANNLPIKNLLNEFAFLYKLKGLSVENGSLSFNALISGKLTQFDINVTSVLKKLQIEDLKNGFTIKIAQGDAVVKYEKKKITGSLKTTNSVVFSRKFKTNILSRKTEIEFDKDKAVINPSELTWGNSGANFKGEIQNFKEPKFELNLNGKVKSTDLYKSLSSVKKFPAGIKGTLPVIAELKGNFNSQRVKLQFATDSSNYVSALVIKEMLNKPGILNLDAEINHNKIAINDCSLYNVKSFQLSSDFAKNLTGAKRIVMVSGKVSDFLNPVLDGVKVVVPESLTASVAGIPGSEISFKTDVAMNGSLFNPKIKGSAFVYRFNVPASKINVQNCTAEFDNNNFLVKVPYLKIGNTLVSLNANGMPHLGKKIVVNNVKINAPNLDIDDILETFGPLFNNVAYPRVNVPLQIKSGSAVISKFHADGVKAQNINTNLSLNNNNLKLQKVTGSAYGGSFWGNIDYNFRSTNLKLNLGGKSLDAATAGNAFLSLPDISGKMDFYSNVNMYGLDKRQKIKSLSGTSSIAVYNAHLGPLGRFEHFLYAQNLISQSIMKSTINLLAQAVAPKDTGRVKYLKANVSFYDGYAKINRCVSSGPNMSMYLSGRYNMLNNWADIEILGKVSHEVANVLGPLGQLSLANIASNIPQLNNVSLPNIFYNNYNLAVPQSTIAKIPDLTPKTQLKTKDFTVKIIGNAESVKSVKSFKWLVLSKNGELPEVQSSTRPKPQTFKPEASPEQYHSIRRENSEVPSFLDKLPD
ncbi:MAG: AsmA family protein [Candidatus Gastranaerophilales bacterium]|nr:AsmA family protein [Candidatus Gastranaerophilales bacterium]